jgi:hypothetical protein
MMHQATARAGALKASRALIDPVDSWPTESWPIGELGCLLVLTQLLVAPIAGEMAVETLQLAARQLGWQPVGDVLQNALERCLGRHHLRADGGGNAGGNLKLTTAGRHWLITLLAQRFSPLPPSGAELLLACQMISLPQLDAASRQKISQAMAAERRDHLRRRRACDRACPAALRPWQDWSRARVIADLQQLERLGANNRALAGDGDEGL